MRSSSLTTALLAIGLAVSAGCSLTQPPSEFPDISVAAIEAERLALDRQVFRVRLRLSNPNDVPIRVAAGRLTLDLETVRVGSGELIEAFKLPAGGEGDAALRIDTDLMDLAPELLPRVLNSGGRLRYRLSGYMDLIGLGLGRIPVDEGGRISLAAPAKAQRL